MFEEIIEFDNSEDIIAIFGNYDENVNLIQKEFNVNIINRQDHIKISGECENVEKVIKVIDLLRILLRNGEAISIQGLEYTISLFKENVDENTVEKAKKLSSDYVCITANGKPIKPKTLGQKKYIEAIKSNTIVLGVGPAGTGKTYLAVALAVKEFRCANVSRIILTRPAVEAGEKLGFLPGDLQDKVDPYLRPLYDALFDMFGAETFAKLVERGSIEVAPLAYMRGRTLDDSFIILDEAQNTTREQMKMFLTRLGANSKAVITGDVTQIDILDPHKSGLINAVKVLKNVENIETIHLTESDVVRNKIVKDIIKAYNKYDEIQEKYRNEKNIKSKEKFKLKSEKSRKFNYKGNS